MPKGIYNHQHIKPKIYPEPMVSAVREMYVEKIMTQVEIASELQTTLKVIYKLMTNHKIPRRPQVKRNQKGLANSSWKGDNAGYSACHKRVEAAFGAPSFCSRCDSENEDGISYDWANLTGEYHNINDYERMCRSCHRRYDNKRRLDGVIS